MQLIGQMVYPKFWVMLVVTTDPQCIIKGQLLLLCVILHALSYLDGVILFTSILVSSPTISSALQ